MPQMKGLITVFHIIDILCTALPEDITKYVISMSDMTLRADSGSGKPPSKPSELWFAARYAFPDVLN